MRKKMPLEYKYVVEKGNMHGPEEVIIDIINREAQDNWVVDSFDFSSGLGRALLRREVIRIQETCCPSGVCTCQ
jgi:hypothetical protein